MEDLLLREAMGLPSEQCKKVEEALKRVWLHAAEIPDRSLFPVSIQHDVKRLLSAYLEWNAPAGGESKSVKKRQQALLL